MFIKGYKLTVVVRLGMTTLILEKEGTEGHKSSYPTNFLTRYRLKKAIKAFIWRRELEEEFNRPKIVIKG